MTFLLLALLAAAPADPAPLTPQADWTLHQIGGRCAVSRSYDDGKFALILRQRLDGSRIDIDVVGMKSAAMRTGVAAHVTTLPDARRIDGTMDVLATNGPPLVEITSADDPIPDLGAVTGLAIDIARAAPLHFAIDRQAAAQTMLRTCHDALVRSWGIEPAQFSPLNKGKVGGRFYGASAYPAAAVINREQGRVSVLIEISPAGVADQCRVVESSNSASLDQATCDIARTKVRFTPAKDDAGQPKASWTILAMRWVLPR